jgi:DegV family protein with EDD domain
VPGTRPRPDRTCLVEKPPGVGVARGATDLSRCQARGGVCSRRERRLDYGGRAGVTLPLVPSEAPAIRHLDGKQLYQALVSGLEAVERKRDYLNRINVFPVADGDTGTNIAATLSYALESARVSESAGETMASVAEEALVGARGSSGIIFAQFLNGLAEPLVGLPRVARERLVQGAENARRRAYEAVTQPREGTILSVMHAWAEALRRELDHSRSIGELLSRSTPALKESLEKTRHALPELRAAGVVDAGASGFVELITGAERFLSSGARARASARKARRAAASETDLHVSGEIRFRYCTEALLAGEAIDRDSLRLVLEPLGDSLIVAGSEHQVRVHLHTDEPARAFSLLNAAGRVVQQKADDMRLQYEIAHERKYPIAIVTDSTCDLPRELVDLYQIQVVPFYVRLGEREYLDRLTISPEAFVEAAEHSDGVPTTSQPAVGVFARLFSQLSTYYDSIIAIHISSRLSGAFGSSERAAASLADGKRISVVDSRGISGSHGLIVLRAAEAVAAGRSHDEILAEIDGWVRKARILVGVRTLDYMVRSGRVKPLQGALAKLLNLKPIVSLDEEGKAVSVDKAYSVRRSVAKIVQLVAASHAEHPLRAYGVVHVHDPEAGRELARRLEQALGFPPLFIEEVSPAVVLHVGRGAVAVTTMQE